MDGPAEPNVETREQFVLRALEQFEGPLVGYANGILHDLERARDVVQDTFIRLCKQDIDKVRDGLKTWLFTVCRNRALDVLRKERRAVPVDDEQLGRTAAPGPSPARQADRRERVGELMHYLERLSENQREVILLKFQQGMSYQEISEVTGLGTGNIGFLIHVGIKRLRELLPKDLLENLG